MRNNARRSCSIKIGTSFILMVLLLTTLTVVPMPSGAADDAVDLELGGQGSTPWSFERLKPGDNGTVPVILVNNGVEAAYVTIWLSNMVEADGGGDGAMLSQYLLLRPRSPLLTTSMDLPAAVRDLPASPEQKALTLGPIQAGAAVELFWDWEFYDDRGPQNEAQGDSLSFDMNYLLTYASAVTSDYNVVLSILGRETVVSVNASGTVTQSVAAASPNNEVVLHIEAGTRIIANDGIRPTTITLRALDQDDAPSLPSGYSKIGAVYEMRALANDEATEASLVGNVTLTVRVDPLGLPSTTRSLALFEAAADDWTRAEGSNTVSWEASGRLTVLGRYVVGASGQAEEGVPFFLALNATARPMARDYWFWPFIFFTISGASAEVEVQLINNGGGDGTCIIVAELDGRYAAHQAVTLNEGETANVTLLVDEIPDGGHNIGVTGRTLDVTRALWINWVLIAAIIITVAIVLYVWRRYGRKDETK